MQKHNKSAPPVQINPTLRRLQVPPGLPSQTLEAGEKAYKEAKAHPLAPRLQRAIARWARHIEELRKGLMPGYTPMFRNNLELTVNRALGVAILVGTGNKWTGIQPLPPDAKVDYATPREHTMLRKLLTAMKQQDLYEKSLIREVWILLVHPEVAAGEIRGELSLITGTQGTSIILGERVILPPFALVKKKTKTPLAPARDEAAQKQAKAIKGAKKRVVIKPK